MHHFVVLISSGDDKSCLLLITQSQWYLVVPLESIQKAPLRMAYCCIHQLINLRHGERVFWTGLIQVCEINAYSPFSTFLLYYHCIG